MWGATGFQKYLGVSRDGKLYNPMKKENFLVKLFLISRLNQICTQEPRNTNLFFSVNAEVFLNTVKLQ